MTFAQRTGSREGPSMETSRPYRPRVSRETRLLLTAGVMAVAALWLLARIRFPERPVTPNPDPSVLSQLASGPTYDDLAREIAQLHARLQSSLLARDVPSALGSLQTSPRTAAIQTARRPRRDVGPARVDPRTVERYAHRRPRRGFRRRSRPCAGSGSHLSSGTLDATPTAAATLPRGE